VIWVPTALWGLAVLAAGVGVKFLGRRRVSNDTAARLHDVAGRLGFTGVPGGYSGVIDAFTVILGSSPHDDLAITVTGLAGRVRGALPYSFGLHPASERPRKEPVTTGDEHFDTRLGVEGAPELCSALLDVPARRFLTEALSRGVLVRLLEGRMEIEVRGTLEIGAIVTVVRAAVRLADSFATAAKDVPGALAHAAAGDPVTGVRLRCLELLESRFPKDPRTRVALRAALAERTAVGLSAAISLGNEGFDTLRDLAVLPKVHGAIRARALEYLVAAFSPGRTLPVVAAALEDPVPPVVAVAARVLQVLAATDSGGLGDEARGAIERLSAPPTPPAVAAHALAVAVGALPPERAASLARGWLFSAVGEHLAAVLRSLAAVGTADDEPDLLTVLAAQTGGVEEIAEPTGDEGRAAVAAVEALGALGTVAAVAPLRDAAARAPFASVLGHAVDAAIARIRSRLPEAAAGQVVVADGGDRSGEVSLAGEAGGGRLALPDEPEEEGEAQ
jgi:hypothetical protein